MADRQCLAEEQARQLQTSLLRTKHNMMNLIQNKITLRNDLEDVQDLFSRIMGQLDRLERCESNPRQSTLANQLPDNQAAILRQQRPLTAANKTFIVDAPMSPNVTGFKYANMTRNIELDSQCFSPRLCSTYYALPTTIQSDSDDSVCYDRTDVMNASTNQRTTMHQPFYMSPSSDDMIMIDDDECRVSLGSRPSPLGANTDTSPFHSASGSRYSHDSPDYINRCHPTLNTDSSMSINSGSSGSQSSINSQTSDYKPIHVDASNVNFIDSNGDILILDVDDLLDTHFGDFSNFPCDENHNQQTSEYTDSETSNVPAAPMNSPANSSSQPEPVYVMECAVPVNSPNRTIESRRVTVRFSASTEERLRRHLSFEPTPHQTKSNEQDLTTSAASLEVSFEEQRMPVKPEPVRKHKNIESAPAVVEEKPEVQKKKKDLKQKMKIFSHIFSRKNKNVKITKFSKA